MAKKAALFSSQFASGTVGACLLMVAGVPSEAAAQDPITSGIVDLAENMRRCDWLVRTASDTDMGPHDTRSDGDIKRAAMTGVCDDRVISLRVSLESPPLPAGGGYANGADHAVAALTIGREFDISTPAGNWRAGVYGEAGWMNGAVSDVLHDAVRSARDRRRTNGTALTEVPPSPDATDGRVLLGVMGRADTSRRITEIGSLRLNFNATPYARLGNDQTLAGVAAGVSLNTGDDGWRPALPHFPAVLNRDIGVYAGLRVEHVFYDAATHRIGTARDRAAVFAGAEINFGDIAVFTQYEQRLTNDITGGRGRPAGLLVLGGRAKF